MNDALEHTAATTGCPPSKNASVGATGPAEPRNLQTKWGKELVSAGWVALPSIILERQEALGLDAIDVNIILHIAKHWFDPGTLPHPSKGSIARAMQIASRTVQKRLAKLESAGFIRRIERRGPKGTKGSQTSQYDLSGLIKQATPFAIEALREREQKRKMQIARLNRKRPRIENIEAEGS